MTSLVIDKREYYMGAYKGFPENEEDRRGRQLAEAGVREFFNNLSEHYAASRRLVKEVLKEE